MRRLSLLSALILFSLPVQAVSSERPPLDTPETAGRPFIDRVHANFNQRLDRYATYFDGFFADERADEEAATTQLRLIAIADYRESDGLTIKQRVKARVNLPRLKRRVNLLIDTESDDTTSLADQIPGIEAAQTRDDETNIALQLVRKSRADIGISHRVGASLTDGNVNPKVRSQVRFTWQLAPRDLLRFTQSGFWEEVDGWGQESRFDYERLLHRRKPERSRLLRISMRGLTSETSDGYEWSLPIEILTALPGQRAYSFGGSISGVTDTETGITNSSLFVRYRQSIWRRWFFFDITPRVEWLKREGREPKGSCRLALEILF